MEDPEPRPKLMFRLENKKLQDYFTEVGEQRKLKYSLPSWMENVESLFKWKTTLNVMLGVSWNITEKMEDYRNQGPDYGFEKFTLLISMIPMNWYRYEEYSSEEDESDSASIEIRNQPEEDFEDITDPETAYKKCKEALAEMAGRDGDVMYTRIGPAMEHVLQATKAHMLYLQGNIAESQEVAKNIQPVSEMSLESQAGIEGIKAKCILSMYKDTEVPLRICQTAIEMDPKFAAWHYLAGKISRRLRREKKKEITMQELDYFEEAVALERNPKYLVFLGQAYQEMAQFISKQRDLDVNSRVHEMLTKSVNLYRECWTLKNDSAAISRRIGNGMLKMRSELCDLALAKEALLKAIELSPNNVTLHELGKFYYKHEKDDEKALEYFDKVLGIFGTGDIIRLNLIKDPNYDPEDRIDYWKKIAIGLSKQDILYCDIGWYYLFFKRDLVTSAKYFWRVLRSDHKSFRVMEYTSYAFCVQGPLNMVKILVNEILLAKEKNNIFPTEEEKDMAFLEDFLEKIFEKNPELIEYRPNPNLMESVRINVERDLNFFRRKRYGNYRKHYNQGYDVKEPAGSWRKKSESEDVESLNNLQNARCYLADDLNSRDRMSHRFDMSSRGRGRTNNREGMNSGFDFHNRNRDSKDGIGTTSSRFDINNRSRDEMSSRFEIGNRNFMDSGNRMSNRFDMSSRDRGGTVGGDRMSSRFDMSNRDRDGINSRDGMRSKDREIIGGGGMSNRFGMSNRDRDGMSGRFNTDNRDRDGMNSRGGIGRQYNNSRYDVTITDWRSEKKN